MGNDRDHTGLRIERLTESAGAGKAGGSVLKLIPPGKGFERLSEATTTEFGALLDLVRQALREKLRATPGFDGYAELQGIWPDRVVARLNGRNYSFAYSLTADNTVTIGEGVEVVTTFVPVREAAAGAAGAHGETAFREAADGSIEVTIIRAGLSANGNYYPDATLRDGAAMFEGVRVFSKSDAQHTAGGGKDVHALLGGIYGVRFVEGAGTDAGSLVGTFKPINPADETVVKMTEAVRRGMAGLMGLSIDAEARVKREKRGTRQVRTAVAFTKVNSVDLIVEPGAGGGLDRLTEATATPHETQEDTDMKKRLFEALKAINAKRAAALSPETATDAQVVVALTEACKEAGIELEKVLEAATAEDVAGATTPLVEAAQAAAKAAQAAQAATQAAAQQRLTEAAGADNAPVTRAELAQHQARLYASAAIASSTLPALAKEKLQAQFKATERFTEAQVDSAIKGEREYLARMSESGRPTGGLPRIEVGDRSVVIADMLDAFFDPAHKNHREVRSIKECYIEMTGDRLVTGRPDRARLTESIGSDTFANALGDSITRRLQQIYRDFVAYDAWRAVCNVTPVNDFRTQERTQIGGFGDLPTVAQRGPYTAFADPSDAKATYAVGKRGVLAQVTLEGIKNDDVGAIRRVPMELARSAKRTLFKFAMNFFASNPTIYDTLALYHATHANLFTGALDATQLAAHRLAMKKQTGRDTATRMEIGPSFLLVPDDLEETAYNLFNRNTNNDKTFIQSLTLKIIPVPTWTDTNDWVTVADPADIPCVEIGFLDGQEEPILFTQDSPTEGSVFTNDVISYKMRHVYGGNVLVDGWKGTTKAVVP